MLRFLALPLLMANLCAAPANDTPPAEAPAAIFRITFPYTEGQFRYQGDYFFPLDAEGAVNHPSFGKVPCVAAMPLADLTKAISLKLPAVVRTSFSLKKIDLEIQKLVARQQVMVSGQVNDPGTHAVTPNSTLGQIVGLAKPTTFGSVRRIQLIRKHRQHTLDLKNKHHRGMKVLSGDYIFVPTMRVFGR